MKRGLNKKLIVGGLAGGLMLGAAGLIIGAGVAKADVAGSNPNLSFLTELRGDGFYVYSPTEALGNGYWVCGLMRQGASSFSVENLVEHQFGWSSDSAVDFVVDAQFTLCTDTLPVNERPSEPAPAQPTPGNGGTSRNGELA